MQTLIEILQPAPWAKPMSSPKGDLSGGSRTGAAAARQGAVGVRPATQEVGRRSAPALQPGAHRAAGRQHGLSVARPPTLGREVVPQPPPALNAVRALDKDNLIADRGGWLHPAERAGRRRAGRPAVSAVTRRRSAAAPSAATWHQRWRHPGGALRQHRATRAWPEVVTPQGDGGMACAVCARTTPATTCATCSSAAKARWASSPPPHSSSIPGPPPSSPPGPPSSMEQAVRCWPCAPAPGRQGLTGFEVMGRFALQLVDAHYAAAARALHRPGRSAHARAAGELRQRIRGPRPRAL